MRDLTELDRYRIRGQVARDVYGWDGDENVGAFVVKSSIDGGELVVVASNDAGWDHVSVSRQKRCPNWYEMEQIKRLFFEDDEVAVQYHVPAASHINQHPHCLHLWRCHDTEYPMPPSIFV